MKAKKKRERNTIEQVPTATESLQSAAGGCARSAAARHSGAATVTFGAPAARGKQPSHNRQKQSRGRERRRERGASREGTRAARLLPKERDGANNAEPLGRPRAAGGSGSVWSAATARRELGGFANRRNGRQTRVYKWAVSKSVSRRQQQNHRSRLLALASAIGKRLLLIRSVLPRMET